MSRPRSSTTSKGVLSTPGWIRLPPCGDERADAKRPLFQFFQRYILGMESELAEVSSMATQIDELVERVVTLAEKHRGGDRDDIAVRLFEVERSLHAAGRNLQSAVRAYQ